MKNILSFILGAGIASIVTYKLTNSRINKKYETMYNEDLKTIRSYYSEKQPVSDDIKKEDKPIIKTTEINRVIFENGPAIEQPNKPIDETYNNTISSYNGEINGNPYAITTEEFMESPYETITLTYYADGVLSDEDGLVINNSEELLGSGNLNVFRNNDGKVDVIYICDDSKLINYEILYDQRYHHRLYQEDIN